MPARRAATALTIAYVREGVGGYPLLLLHGYPETKRIWWRNIEPLVAAGYEVIVPDLRGYGDSDLSADDVYDLAAYSRDLYALVHDVLGHERCGVVGGDVGGAAAVDMLHRFPGFVDKLVLLRHRAADGHRGLRRRRASTSRRSPRSATAPPATTATARARRPTSSPPSSTRRAKRRRYIGEMYGHRLWASPGTFTPPTSTS